MSRLRHRVHVPEAPLGHPYESPAMTLLREAHEAGIRGESWEVFVERCRARARLGWYFERLMKMRPGQLPLDDPPVEWGLDRVSSVEDRGTTLSRPSA